MSKGKVTVGKTSIKKEFTSEDYKQPMPERLYIPLHNGQFMIPPIDESALIVATRPVGEEDQEYIRKDILSQTTTDAKTKLNAENLRRLAREACFTDRKRAKDREEESNYVAFFTGVDSVLRELGEMSSGDALAAIAGYLQGVRDTEERIDNLMKEEEE